MGNVLINVQGVQCRILKVLVDLTKRERNYHSSCDCKIARWCRESFFVKQQVERGSRKQRDDSNRDCVYPLKDRGI